MIPFGLSSLMTVSLPIGRRATKCLVPGASAIYLFNEGAGTTLTDYSGNGHDGTFATGGNAPSWSVEGVVFDAAAFTRVALPDVGARLSGGATFQAVAKPGADITTIQGLIGCGTDKAGTLGILNGKGVIYAPSGTSGKYLYSTDIAANTWVDLAASVVWSGALAAYLNGAPSTTGTTTGAWVTPGATAQAIGSRGAANGPFTGTIAAALVYPFILTPAQVAQNHAALKGILAARGITLA